MKISSPLGDLFNLDRVCEPVDPGRFEEGVNAGLTEFHAAHSPSGPVDFKERFNPLHIEGIGTIKLNEFMPENRMMAGFLGAYGTTKSMSEKSSAIARMLGFFMFIQEELKRKDGSPTDLFEVQANSEIGISVDLFRAAALAPISMGGRFNREELFRLARLGQEAEGGVL